MLAAQQNAPSNQARDQQVAEPVMAAARLQRRLAENNRHKAQHHAEQPQRRQLVPARLSRLLLDQVGQRDHRRQREHAVADEIGRHMQLHPPAFQRGHQRLDFMGFADHGVPEQKTDRAADHQHDKSAQRAGLVLSFKIQVKGRCHPRKQHEHFVQIADRNVTDIGANQVALVPAHQRANQGHADAGPGDFRAQRFERRAVAGTAGGRGIARKHAEPVKNRAHEKQHAHPQNRRLARQKILEPKHLLGPRQIALIRADAQQRKAADHQHQDAQGSPEPAQRNRRRNGRQQNAFFIDIHVSVVACKGV